METSDLLQSDDKGNKKEEEKKVNLTFSLLSSAGVAIIQIVVFAIALSRLTLNVADWIDLRLAREQEASKSWFLPSPKWWGTDDPSWGEFALQYGRILLPSIFSHKWSKTGDGFEWYPNGMTCFSMGAIFLLQVHFSLAVCMGFQLLRGIVTKNEKMLKVWIIFAVYSLFWCILSNFIFFFGLVWAQQIGSAKLFLLSACFTGGTAGALQIVFCSFQKLNGGQGLCGHRGKDDQVEGDNQQPTESAKQGPSEQ